MACAFKSKKIHIWDISRFLIINSISESNSISCIEFISESILAVGTSSEINIWNVDTKNRLKRINVGKRINDLVFLTNQILLSSDSGPVIRTWTITTWTQLKSKNNAAQRMAQLDRKRFVYIGPTFYIRKISDLSSMTSQIPQTQTYDSLKFFNNRLILARRTKVIEIYNVSDWSSKKISSLHSLTINALEPILEKNDTIDDSVIDYVSELDNATGIIDTEYPFSDPALQLDYSLTDSLAISTINPFMASVISISNLFAILDMKNINIGQLIENLQNKSFSFDLSQPSSQLPTSLLTSSKYDIANCVSNCSNHGLCKLNGNKFECSCDLDFTGSRCETDLRPCTNNPCLNFIKCDNIQNGTQFNQDYQRYENYYPDFICTCKDNYFGKRCASKINLCENETCSGNGFCKVIKNEAFQNESIKCECFGNGQFLGDKCETKSAKMVVHEATVKTTSYIAIGTLITFYALVGFMDIHKYFIMKKSNIFQKKRIPRIKNIHETSDQNKQSNPFENNLNESVANEQSNQIDQCNYNIDELVVENVPDQI